MKIFKTAFLFILIFCFSVFCHSYNSPAADRTAPAAEESTGADTLITAEDSDAAAQVTAERSIPTAATVIFTFDDGCVSDYALAYPILQKYGIKGTSYIIPGFMDNNTKGKLEWQQVKEMAAYGWAFGYHTYDHQRLTAMTDDEIKKSMEAENLSFTRHGFAPPEIMAYPYGSFNQRVIRDIKPYVKQARLAYRQNKLVDLKNIDPYKIPSISADITSEGALAKDQKVIDKACAEKAVVVFRTHAMYLKKAYDTVVLNKAIRSGSCSQTNSALFEELVRYCVDKGCTFITMTQLMRLYS